MDSEDAASEWAKQQQEKPHSAARVRLLRYQDLHRREDLLAPEETHELGELRLALLPLFEAAHTAWRGYALAYKDALYFEDDDPSTIAHINEMFKDALEADTQLGIFDENPYQEPDADDLPDSSQPPDSEEAEDETDCA